MSFLDKLLKGKVEEAAKELLGGVLGGSKPAQKPAQSSWQAPAQQSCAAEPKSPSGFSWGDQMPAEENQFSYPGSYREYFESVFRAEFPQYQLQTEEFRSGCVITFLDGGRKALVVELKSEHSEANRLRKNCQREGLPYLRFYHNHHGWWNTRSYVVTRTRAALGL